MPATSVDVPRILCIGLIGKETIRSPCVKFEGWGGAATYFGASAASTGAAVDVVTALSETDSIEFPKLLDDLASTLHLRQVPTGNRCHFDLVYGEQLELTEFSYAGGGLSDDPQAIEAVCALVELAIETGRIDHLHVCPLPPDLMEALAPIALQQRVPISVQAHFSEIESSRKQLLDLMSRADFVFMNREEAHSLLSVSNGESISSSYREAFSGLGFVTDAMGVLVISTENSLRFTASALDAVDPTGGGDAFAGGAVGRLAAGADVRAAVNTGLALAGVAVGTYSSAGILPLSQSGHPATP